MSQKLLDYGFRYFDSYQLYQAGTQFHQAEVWLGEQNQVMLGIQEDMQLTLPKGSASSVQIQVKTTKELHAPLAQGQVFGEVVVKLKDQVIATSPLVAFHDVAEAGFMKKIWHRFKLMLRSLWADA